MTDDLQRVNLEAEVGLRSVLAMLHATLVNPIDLVCTVLLSALIALGIHLLARLAMVSSRQNHLPRRVLWYRPTAVRPPTSFRFLLPSHS